ncbi:putative cyclin-D7-1 [Camellia lanceoleosa]|uniref:Cyclin-D7-1 n=1 Tax=Camellia lanceoleosa TaxID=1840588 RepID=A0ACC0G7K8_9ERIC|nr:putative cyclin-D7-1 [Camellia lanceoleosa]
MDSLLCDEVWLTTSPTTTILNHNYGGSFYTTKEDSQQAFDVCLQKEIGYTPESQYQDHLQSSGLILARFRAMQWLLKSQRRLNLSCQTVFNAANYFDRFLSMNQCKGWKYWMVELLAIACLSVAYKFGETTHLPLHEIQMEDLDHSFQSSLIQRMELTLLKTLGWRLGSVTTYSYIELLMWNFDSLTSFLLGELTTRVTDLLLSTLSDSKFVEFRPCVVAISALRCVIQDSLPSPTYNAHLDYVTRLIPEDQKDDLIKCHKIMEEKMVWPSSPVTVLKMEYNWQVDLSLFNKMHGFNVNQLKSSKMKRKREE